MSSIRQSNDLYPLVQTITKPAIPSCPLVADEVDGTVEKKRLRRKRKSKIGAIRKKHSVPRVTQDVQVQKVILLLHELLSQNIKMITCTRFFS